MRLAKTFAVPSKYAVVTSVETDPLDAGSVRIRVDGVATPPIPGEDIEELIEALRLAFNSLFQGSLFDELDEPSTETTEP